MEQLHDNVAALDVKLTAAHLADLDAQSRPKLPFPSDFIANSAGVYYGGTTINGKSAPAWPMAPQGDKDRY